MAAAEFLETCAWFRRLPQQEQARLRAVTTQRKVAASSYLCRQGERLDHWIGIIHGTAAMVCDSADGRRSTYVILSPGSWFGEGSLIKDEALRFESVAKTDCQLACVPRPVFMDLYDNSVAFSHALIEQLNARCGQFLGNMMFDRMGNAEQRVARSILSLLDPVLYPGTGPLLQLSQEEVGYLAGLSRQVVNGTLKKLEKKGLVEIQFRQISIVDMPALRALVQSV